MDESEWRELIRKGDTSPPPTVVAETYLRKWGTSSTPVAVTCNDKSSYVVKGWHVGRAVVNEHVVARLGAEMGAPVGPVALVNVTQELINAEPEMSHMAAGISHGTRFVRGCGDSEGLGHTAEPENRDRFARLAVLFGWILAGDQQFIYEVAAPNKVYSVDHGHFFPGGPAWTIDMLNAATAATIDAPIAAQCAFTDAELAPARAALQAITDEVIATVAAGPPDEWGLVLDERVVLAQYLSRRRDDLVGAPQGG